MGIGKIIHSKGGESQAVIVFFEVRASVPELDLRRAVSVTPTLRKVKLGIRAREQNSED